MRAYGLLVIVGWVGAASCGSSDGPGSSCGDGAVTAACACGGVDVTGGYCCDDSRQATPCGAPAFGDLVAPDRVTAWNPGILEDTQLGLPLQPTGIPTRTTVCATLAPGDDIQAAVAACPEGQVVELGPGRFTVSDTITLTRGVVLRGAGSGADGTTIVKIGGETVLAIGTDRDQICYGGDAVDLVADAAKEGTVLRIAPAEAAAFHPGDLALVDLVDDAAIDQGDCGYFKRVSGRSASQRVEIAAVDAGAGELTLAAPLHWPFPTTGTYAAQLTRVTRPVTRWAGIEHLRVSGGTNPGYPGEMAGGIDISNAAYSWVADVETDAVGGMHVAMTGTYRCVVRDGYFHHSANYGFGADCYGIVLRCGAADNLVENNIVRYMNKPIMFNASGGGNVVAYNYADNSWADPPAWQEVNIDTHCAFPHMELMEGNYAPHVGATITHGNAGYLTYFRNYASSQFAPPAVAGADVTQTGNVTAIQFQAGDVGMTVVGNVLGTAGVSTDYEVYDTDPRSIFQLGGAADVSATSLYRDGNYDTVHAEVVWASGRRDLPPSAFRTKIPAWWPAGVDWPWVGPDLAARAGTLPAKARSDGLPP